MVWRFVKTLLWCSSGACLYQSEVDPRSRSSRAVTPTSSSRVENGSVAQPNPEPQEKLETRHLIGLHRRVNHNFSEKSLMIGLTFVQVIPDWPLRYLIMPSMNSPENLQKMGEELIN